MNKIITDEQIQTIGNILLELPAKNVLPAIDLLRNLPAQQETEEKDEKKTNNKK